MIWAGTNGYLDALSIDRVRPFEDALLATLRTQNAAILDDIRTTKDLSDGTAGKLKAVVEQVQKTFL